MHGHHLSLDDVEKKVWVSAATEEVTETQGLVEAFDLLLDLRGRPTRRTPKHQPHLSLFFGRHKKK